MCSFLDYPKHSFVASVRLMPHLSKHFSESAVCLHLAVASGTVRPIIWAFFYFCFSFFFYSQPWNSLSLRTINRNVFVIPDLKPVWQLVVAPLALSCTLRKTSLQNVLWLEGSAFPTTQDDTSFAKKSVLSAETGSVVSLPGLWSWPLGELRSFLTSLYRLYPLPAVLIQACCINRHLLQAFLLLEERGQERKMPATGFLTCVSLVLASCFCCCAASPQLSPRQPVNDRPVIGKWNVNNQENSLKSQEILSLKLTAAAAVCVFSSPQVS